MRGRLWASSPVLVLLDGGVLCPESGASQHGLPGTTVGGPRGRQGSGSPLVVPWGVWRGGCREGIRGILKIQGEWSNV